MANPLKVPVDQNVQLITFNVPANITSTADPIFRYIPPQRCKPLYARVVPLTEFDRTTGDETYVLSVEVATVKVSTDNTAIGTGNKALPMTCTIPDTQVVAADAIIEVIATLGGTSPIIPAGSLVILAVQHY